MYRTEQTSFRYLPSITAVAAKARITADFPTPSEVASRLRIPASRVAELRRQIDDVLTTGTRRPPRRQKLAKKK